MIALLAVVVVVVQLIKQYKQCMKMSVVLCIDVLGLEDTERPETLSPHLESVNTTTG